MAKYVTGEMWKNVVVVNVIVLYIFDVTVTKANDDHVDYGHKLMLWN